MTAEGVAVAFALQVVPQRFPGLQQSGLQVGDGFAVEAQDVAYHAEEARRCQIASLREQGIDAAARVLEAAVEIADAEAHVRRLAADAEFLQQGDKIGVGPVVVDDEARVHGIAPGTQLDINGGRVAPDLRPRLKHGHAVRAAEIMGRRTGRKYLNR